MSNTTKNSTKKAPATLTPAQGKSLAAEWSKGDAMERKGKGYRARAVYRGVVGHGVAQNVVAQAIGVDAPRLSHIARIVRTLPVFGQDIPAATEDVWAVAALLADYKVGTGKQGAPDLSALTAAGLAGLSTWIDTANALAEGARQARRKSPADKGATVKKATAAADKGADAVASVTAGDVEDAPAAQTPAERIEALIAQTVREIAGTTLTAAEARRIMAASARIVDAVRVASGARVAA